MPDITMCSGKDCPRAEQCYRYTAKPNPWRQSFFASCPVKDDGICEHFSPLRSSDWISKSKA